MKTPAHNDTICAAATPPGIGAVAVVRLSGPRSLDAALQCFRPSGKARRPRPRVLEHGWWSDHRAGAVVDEVLLAYMPAPHSHTGEDVVEIHCHGGAAAPAKILETLRRLGVRLAEPGEFTRRAFLNGRLDLSQAEAVADLISARSTRAMEAAASQLRGDFRRLLESWRDLILIYMAEIESRIDFVDDLDDEADSAPPKNAGWAERIRSELIGPIRAAAAHRAQARLLREGLALAIVGKPNVGKSSLLNALLGRERAIVTSLPGTTRDVVEDEFLIDGVPVRIADTAGIRGAPEKIELMGIRKTRETLNRCQAALWIVDGSVPLDEHDDELRGLVAEKPHIPLLNKADLPAATTVEDYRRRYDGAPEPIVITVFSNEDVERVRRRVASSFLRPDREAPPSPVLPNLRQKERLDEAIAALERASLLMEQSGYPELIMEELRLAKSELGEILGLNAGPDLLDAIFSRFCIGK